MNHFVPGFEQVQQDDSVPTASGLYQLGDYSLLAAEDCSRNNNIYNSNNNIEINNKNSERFNGPDQQMELMWSADGPRQRQLFRTPNLESTFVNTASAYHPQQPQLLMEEDEMMDLLLQQPTVEEQQFGGTDLLYHPPPPPAVTYFGGRGGSVVTRISESVPPAVPPMPVAPPRRAELESQSNFCFFQRGRGETSAASAVANQIPIPIPPPVAAEPERDRNRDRETYTLDRAAATVTSSSSVYGERSEDQKKAAKKRKAKQEEDDEDGEEDLKIEQADTRKRARGSTSCRRTRAAEVHNESERRRRDRINGKMKVLQELVPNANKTDKASMLDAVIECIKQLQQQVQLGCNMVPMMFPDGKQYMVPMAAGMPPRFPYPVYLPPTGPLIDASRMPTDQSNPAMHHYGVPGLDVMPVPFPNAYQSCFGYYGIPALPHQPPQTNANREASNSKAVENHVNLEVEMKKPE